MRTPCSSARTSPATTSGASPGGSAPRPTTSSTSRTKDGYIVRVKPMSITEKRIQASQETAVRTLMTNELQTAGAEMTISDIIRSVISGEMAKRLSTVSKVVVPIKRIEIRKTEVIQMGSAPQDVPVFAAPEPEPEPEVAEEAPEVSSEAPAEEEIAPADKADE